jgi:hypothetical protein
VVGAGPEGQPRARILQGTRTRLGPLLIGVLAARRRTPAKAAGAADGAAAARSAAEADVAGTADEVFARLQLGDGERLETLEVVAGDEVDLGTGGRLRIEGVIPQDPEHSGPGMPTSARGAVFVELRGTEV